MAGIVVGVDGSPHSQAALDWALDEAALRNAHLTALAVAPAVTGYWGIFSQADSSHEEQERVNQAAKDMVEKAAQRPRPPAGGRADRQWRALRRASQGISRR